jgi:CBS domain-containing protein
MQKHYPVEKIMVKALITLKPDMNIFSAIDILVKHKISGAPVVDKQGKLVGILSEKDCLELMVESYEHSGYGELVSDYLTKNVKTIGPDENIFAVADIFYNNHFRRMPVLDKGKLVGQVSRRDILLQIQKLIKKEQKITEKVEAKAQKKAEKGDKAQIEITVTVDNLKTAINNVSSLPSALRPQDAKRRPGGLVTFADTDKREMVVVGDLHGNHENLRAIYNEYKTKLESDKAVIVLLGDLFHSDKSGHITDMGPSMLMVEVIIKLLIKFPKNVIYLMGNHDTFSPKLSKRQVLQGKLFYEAMVKNFGKPFTKSMDQLFDSLPVMVLHPWFMAMHAGPIRGGATPKDIINIRQNADHLRQITWNRVNMMGANPSKKEYGPSDLDEMREKMGADAKVPVIVGHNPFWHLGEENSIWENMMNCHDHVILTSNLEHKCPYLSFNGSSRYTIKYAPVSVRESQTNQDYFSSGRY